MFGVLGLASLSTIQNIIGNLFFLEVSLIITPFNPSLRKFY